jgi:hypothetical protein
VNIFHKFFIFALSIILSLGLIIFLTIFIQATINSASSYLSLIIFLVFPALIFLINKYLKSKYLSEPNQNFLSEYSQKRKKLNKVSHKTVKRKSKKWTTKGRAIETLQWELEDLIHDDIRLVASAYRSSISSNSFGKKNYAKFKKELLEHLLDNTDSNDVRYYAENLGNFEVPDHTMFEIERAISNHTRDEEFDDEMDPYVYEHFCAEQFLIAGWDDAEATSGSSDQGVDVIAKRGDDFLVGQCKKYQKPVGNSAVQEIVAGMGYYGANIGVVISNAGYTNSAKKLAEANNIKLIHHAEIKNL